MYRKFLKPTFDFLAAFMGLIFLLPVFFAVALILAIVNKGNPFFFQDRPGKNEHLFKIVKFKTMTDERDRNGDFLPDEKRLTPMGKFVRKTSLDEIPQLINVLRGEMSIVGPRPLLPEYLSLYNDFQRQRHLVRPGITGLAQVKGRNSISWEQKFNMDVHYVRNLSFGLDLKILFQTLMKVLKTEGINSEGQATTTKFRGNL